MSCLDCTEMDLSLKLPYKGQSRLIALGLYNAAWVSCENVAWNEGQWKGAELAKQVWLKLCNQERDWNYGKIPHSFLRINFFCCIFRLPSEPMGQLEKYTAMTSALWESLFNIRDMWRMQKVQFLVTIPCPFVFFFPVPMVYSGIQWQDVKWLSSTSWDISY